MATPNLQGGTRSRSPDVKLEDQDSAIMMEGGKKRRVATPEEDQERDNRARTAIEEHKTDNMQDIEQPTGADAGGGTSGVTDKGAGSSAPPPPPPGSDPDFDPDAPPVPDTVDAALPLSGLTPTSVAMREGNMRTPTYVNAYSSVGKHKWYAFGPFEGDAKLEDLLNLANPISRRISKQVPNVKKDKVKPEAYLDIVDVVFEYNYTRDFPLEAVESLNPRTVKKTINYPTPRARREYTRDHGRLPVFPTSLCRVKWRDSDELTWELASDLKSLLSKRLFKIELKIYRVAEKRAQDIEQYIRKNRVETPAQVESSREQSVRARQPATTQSQTPIPSVEDTGQDNGQTNVAAAVPGTPSTTPQRPLEPAVVGQGPGTAAGPITPPPSKSPEPAQRGASDFNAEEFSAFYEEFCKQKGVDPKLKTNKAAALGQYQALLDLGVM